MSFSIATFSLPLIISLCSLKERYIFNRSCRNTDGRHFASSSVRGPIRAARVSFVTGLRIEATVNLYLVLYGFSGVIIGDDASRTSRRRIKVCNTATRTTWNFPDGTLHHLRCLDVSRSGITEPGFEKLLVSPTRSTAHY